MLPPGSSPGNGSEQPLDGYKQFRKIEVVYRGFYPESQRSESKETACMVLWSGGSRRFSAKEEIRVQFSTGPQIENNHNR